MFHVMCPIDTPLIYGGMPPPSDLSSMPGRSTWMTSAPSAPRFIVDHGPTMISVRSKTRIPSSGPLITAPPLLNGVRVAGRADCTRYVERRRHEHELVNAVCDAV